MRGGGRGSASSIARFRLEIDTNTSYRDGSNIRTLAKMIMKKEEEEEKYRRNRCYRCYRIGKRYLTYEKSRDKDNVGLLF